MKIHKVFNNNLASIIDENDNEVIVMGRGIAFQKKAGDELDESRIDKRFYLEDVHLKDKLNQFLNEIPMQYMEVANSIIDYAKISLNKTFKDSLFISLSDHIYSTIQRLEEGFSLKNPMLWEIRRFYEPEYEVGLQALKIIEKLLGFKLAEDEAGSIAIHIVYAEMDNCTIDNVYEITKVIQDISNIVKYFFNIDFDTKSVYYYRFITHIRFFAQRLVLRTTYDENSEDSLYQIIKEKYVNAYQCVCKIEEYIKQNFDYTISNDEKLYLMIHIERIVYKSNQ